MRHMAILLFGLKLILTPVRRNLDLTIMAPGFIIGKSRLAQLLLLFGAGLTKSIIGILFRCTLLLSALFYTVFMFCGTVQEIMALLIFTIRLNMYRLLLIIVQTTKTGRRLSPGHRFGRAKSRIRRQKTIMNFQFL